MKRKKRRSASPRGALIRGMATNLPSEMLTDAIFKAKLKELLRGNAGIYALYKDGNLYYIGLARSLHGRIRRHLKDKHAGKWNRFRVFIIRKVRYVKDIETLLLNVALPRGNSVNGKVPRKSNLNRVLQVVLREHQTKIRAIRKALR